MLIYPTELMNNIEDRPLVIFRNVVNDSASHDTHIALPIPTSISFSDSATYNNSEIGFVGATILGGASASSVSGALSNVANMAANSLPSDLRSLAGLIGNVIGDDNMKNVSSLASRTTLNKNIVTTFDGVGTRSFTFNFKLVSNSQKDSDVILSMINIFRRGIYPTGNALQLKYPPNWYINFKKNKEEIKYIPKIFECFLTSLNTNYNPSNNWMHTDGSPKEIDLSLSFTESRALIRKDIENLENNAFAEGDFLKPYLDASRAAKLANDLAQAVDTVTGSFKSKKNQ